MINLLNMLQLIYSTFLLFSNSLDLNKENLHLTFSQAFCFHSLTDIVMYHYMIV